MRLCIKGGLAKVVYNTNIVNDVDDYYLGVTEFQNAQIFGMTPITFTCILNTAKMFLVV